MAQACPGYATYESFNNGQVLVNGALPVFEEAKERESIETAWGKHGAAVERVAREYDIPAAWLVGIMMAESRGNEYACSSCAACRSELCETAAGRSCCAFGLMQMIGPTARAYGTTPQVLMGNAQASLDAAARLMVVLEEKYGRDLVKIAAGYNGGIKSCSGSGTTFGYATEGDYPLKVVKYANTFLSMGLKPAVGLMGPLGWVFALTGAVAAAAIYSGKIRV